MSPEAVLPRVPSKLSRRGWWGQGVRRNGTRGDVEAPGCRPDLPRQHPPGVLRVPCGSVCVSAACSGGSCASSLLCRCSSASTCLVASSGDEGSGMTSWSSGWKSEAQRHSNSTARAWGSQKEGWPAEAPSQEGPPGKDLPLWETADGCTGPTLPREGDFQCASHCLLCRLRLGKATPVPCRVPPGEKHHP